MKVFGSINSIGIFYDWLNYDDRRKFPKCLRDLEMVKGHLSIRGYYSRFDDRRHLLDWPSPPALLTYERFTLIRNEVETKLDDRA